MKIALKREQSQVIKGICILLIILHHFTQHFGILPYALWAGGAVGCAAFFFISGYGLAVSVGNRQKWKTRMAKVVIPFILANIVYVIYYALLGEANIGLTLLTDLFGLTLVNGHGWFMQVLIILYLIVAYSDIYLKHNTTFVVLATAIWGGVYSYIVFTPGFLSTWAFAIGYICGKNSNQNVRSVNQFILVITVLSLGCCWYYLHENTYINTLARLCNFMVMIASVPFLFVGVSYYVKNNRVLIYLGRNSIDFYLTHGLVLYSFHWLSLTAIWKVLLYIVCVLVIGIAFGNIRKKVVDVCVNIIN